MPVVGNRVRILKGVYAGELGTVKNVDESQRSCLYVVAIDERFGILLTPDEAEILPDPKLGDTVRVLGGVHVGKLATVMSLDSDAGHVWPVYVEGVGFAGRYRTTEVEIVKPVSETPGNPIDLYPIGDWRYAVANHDTYLGYTAWQAERIEQAR